MGPAARACVLGMVFMGAAGAGTGDAAPDLLLPDTVHHYYVAPNGADDNDGTAAAPFRSIARAARAAMPDSTVHVAPGVYEGGFRTSVNGSGSGRIYFVSTIRWGALIVAPASAGATQAWDNRGDYIDIVGFQVDGSGAGWTYGIYNGGSYGMIRNNLVHHVASQAMCTSAGGAGIGGDGYYGGLAIDVVGNLVHDIGPPGCRFFHGIYLSTTGSVKNNVVYRAAEGAIHLWHDAHDVVIANNTVTTSHTGIIVGGGDYYHHPGPNNNTIVVNNIVYDNTVGIAEAGQTGPGNRYANNLVYQNAAANFRLRNALAPSATVRAAPRFVGYARSGSPDLHLGARSPAIGKGTAMHAPASDFDGMPRSAATGYDIGAYQRR